MNIPLRKAWTLDEFFSWAETQPTRYEFDGVQPVAMTGGSLAHGTILRNLGRELSTRLRRQRCQPFGPDVGVATVGSAVRYPDGLITCSPQDLTSHLVVGVVVVVEIISPSRTDRLVKVREYAAVASILRYVLLESTTIGVTVHERKQPDEPWQTSTLTSVEEILRMPEVGIEIPVADLYEGLSFSSDLDTDER
jgi:Uma2 family endonuclease